MKNCQIFHVPLEIYGPEYSPSVFSCYLGDFGAEMNDLALRQRLMLIEVWNFSLGDHFVLDKLIYIAVIKFKPHKRL